MPRSSETLAVLRVGSSVATAVLTWVVIGWFVVDLLIKGTLADWWMYLPWLGLVAWVVYLVFFRSRVVVGPDAVTCHEIVRTYWLPYERVSDITVGGGVTITYDADGRPHQVHPWNAPGVLKLRRAYDHPTGEQTTVKTADGKEMDDLPPRREPTAPLLEAWSSYAHSGSPRDARVTWNWWQWTVAGVLLVLGVL